MARPVSLPYTPPPTTTLPPPEASASPPADSSAMLLPPEAGEGFARSLLDNDILLPLLGQLSLGGILGLATGFALKKALKLVLILVGGLFILLQLGVFFDLISINWLRIQTMVNPFLEPDSLQRNWQGFLAVLTANIPFAGGFVPMLIVGLRLG